MVSMDMMCHIREGGISAEKYLIKTLESLMLAQAM